MSETYPPSKRSNKARLVSHLYDYTSNIAESRGYDSNRGLAAGTAAAMLGLGLDKLDTKNTSSTAELPYSEEEAKLIDKVASSAEEMQGEQAHFMDRFMDILVRSTMPDSPEAAEIQMRMHDPSRMKKPPLSVRVFVKNLKALSGKIGAFFKIQYGIVHVFTWHKPTKTLCVLVAYTCVCLWPHLVLSFPLLFLLFGVIIPGYLHRHPMDTPELIPVKRRGQSLLEYFNDSKDDSVLIDLLEERTQLADEDPSIHSGESLSSASAEPRGTLNKSSPKGIDSADKLNPKDKKKFVKSQVSLLINMRDLQNLTGDILASIDNGEKLVNQLTTFKDERLTTFIFYIVIVATSFVLFFGRYIPWRIIFIQSGWAVLVLCHPNTKKYLVSVTSNPPGVSHKKESDSQGNITSEFLDNFDRQDIIVDEQPEVRSVEIFELQMKDVFKQEWNFYAYSKRLFDFRDSVRIAGRLPHGVDHLGKVFPPQEWKYDFGYANNWRIDTNPNEFLTIRRLDRTHLKIREEDSEGWIYDKLPIDQDTTQEFRRRRLYRTCYRYARPPKTYKIE
ncbi:hypothetical protein JCM33374_g5525 [Metschnikowia sp. JCM 33374]|nr:hypothetical protein JCM33374_g5525 [Metschnikowia sp. JCM 33374]